MRVFEKLNNNRGLLPVYGNDIYGIDFSLESVYSKLALKELKPGWSLKDRNLSYVLPVKEDVALVLGEIVRIVELKGGAVVVDFGCGSGFLLKLISEALKQARPDVYRNTLFVGIEKDSKAFREFALDLGFVCSDCGLSVQSKD